MSLDWRMLRFDAVASTMDIVDEHAKAGAAEGLVVLADEQLAGRGRSGRTWSAAPGSSLLCSILMRPAVEPTRLGPLPLLIGVAVAEAIERCAPGKCGLKWPNDVLHSERKIAGILMQTRIKANGVDYVNVGIGINVRSTESDLPPGATSIRLAGGTADRESVLAHLLDRIDAIYDNFLTNRKQPYLSNWERRAVLLGERVSIVRDGELEVGVFQGVADDGRLLLLLDSGDQIAVAHGEIERGPRVA